MQLISEQPFHKHVKVVQKRLYLDKDITTSAAICCNCLASVQTTHMCTFVCEEF